MGEEEGEMDIFDLAGALLRPEDREGMEDSLRLLERGEYRAFYERNRELV